MFASRTWVLQFAHLLLKYKGVMQFVQVHGCQVNVIYYLIKMPCIADHHRQFPGRSHGAEEHVGQGLAAQHARVEMLHDGTNPVAVGSMIGSVRHQLTAW